MAIHMGQACGPSMDMEYEAHIQAVHLSKTSGTGMRAKNRRKKARARHPLGKHGIIPPVVRRGRPRRCIQHPSRSRSVHVALEPQYLSVHGVPVGLAGIAA